MPLCQAGMKAVAVTFCVLCFQFEALYGLDSCSLRACKNIDQVDASDAQVIVEFENGNFSFTFPNPQNVSEFSMTLFKGREKKEICAFHLGKEKVTPIFLPPPYIDCCLKESYLYIQDKEDCFSLGLVSWVIIGLIIFAISCICCVVACCLRNKNQKCESSSHEYNSEYMPMAAVNAAKKPRV
ncbi:inducible T-cell costimulator-like isoform X2 [Catharus ustulatus]|uniref:inducible T-cell costimulator-like isoform X2 n=1 Tax=Catharus ustulatus TaxID=91951 RepID=UPI00140C3ADF|nr:inducible T-cell costimulator-like isoform X2 [Catharus ustulatus]